MSVECEEWSVELRSGSAAMKTGSALSDIRFIAEKAAHAKIQSVRAADTTTSLFTLHSPLPLSTPNSTLYEGG